MHSKKLHLPQVGDGDNVQIKVTLREDTLSSLITEGLGWPAGLLIDSSNYATVVFWVNVDIKN